MKKPKENKQHRFMLSLYFESVFQKLSTYLYFIPSFFLPSLYFSTKKYLYAPTTLNVNSIHMPSVVSSLKGVSGMISDWEGHVLYLLSSTGSLSGDIVEIGSWLGKSTIFLAKGCIAANNGIVHAIDTFEGNPGNEKLYTKPLKNTSIIDQFKKNLRMSKTYSAVRIYHMSSADAKNQITVRPRLVFIDGCHEYGSVVKDIQIWGKKLQNNGILVLHDVHPTSPEVMLAVRELMKSKTYQPLFHFERMLVLKKIRKGTFRS